MNSTSKVENGDIIGCFEVVDNTLIIRSGVKDYIKVKCVLCQDISKKHLTIILKNKPEKCGKCSRCKHNMSKTRIYSIWTGIKMRCLNQNEPGYKRYGAIGITICDEWKNDFTTFYNWAIENGYKDHLTIDRRDNNLGYSPENCRWVTNQQNGWNSGGVKNSSSKYKGVSLDKSRGKWRACIKTNSKFILIGRYDNEEEATLAYNQKAIELFGEYAYLNKIRKEND